MKKITIEQFETIMNDESVESKFPEGDNALVGLNIIAKYLPRKGIEGAEHDIIYSVDVEEIVEAGITEEDTRRLKELNWMIEEETCLACFV